MGGVERGVWFGAGPCPGICPELGDNMFLVDVIQRKLHPGGDLVRLLLSIQTMKGQLHEMVIHIIRNINMVMYVLHKINCHWIFLELLIQLETMM